MRRGGEESRRIFGRMKRGRSQGLGGDWAVFLYL